MFSCAGYKKYVMFQTDTEYINDSIREAVLDWDGFYRLEPYDKIRITVFSSNGERLIDPDKYLLKESTIQSSTDDEMKPQYLVGSDGKVNLPLVGLQPLGGLTLRQSDSLLNIVYSKYYDSAFVVTKIINKRVTVIGPTGAKLIPLENNDVQLLEVLALYGGLNTEFDARKIRIIRGDSADPDVQIIDLSTIEGMRKANLRVMPNDVIYVEPTKRIFREATYDILPIATIITSLLTTALLIISLQ
jgi:polysaccharide export outer membrane protein